MAWSEGPYALAMAFTLLIMSIVLVVVGVASPYWQTGDGLDYGLFHVCRKLRCELHDYDEEVLYFVDVVIVLGVIALALSFGAALHLCVQRCQKLKLSTGTPKCLTIGCVLGAIFVVIGVIVYCAAVYDDSKYSFSFSPWITLAGALLCGVAGYLMQRAIAAYDMKVKDEKYGGEEMELQPREAKDDIDAAVDSPDQPKKLRKKGKHQELPPLEHENQNSNGFPGYPIVSVLPPIGQRSNGIHKRNDSADREKKEVDESTDRRISTISGSNVLPIMPRENSDLPYSQYGDPSGAAPPPKPMPYDQDTYAVKSSVMPAVPGQFQDPVPYGTYDRDPNYTPTEKRVLL